jgi:hypothetical protein
MWGMRPRRKLAGLTLALFTLGLAAGCGTVTAADAGPVTHWLRSCDVTALVRQE